jgi:hypothetical protein
MRSIAILSLVTAIAVGLSQPAQAYVDPNAGGLLFQLVTPIVALAAAGLTFARRQLLRLWDSLVDALKALAARLFSA